MKFREFVSKYDYAGSIVLLEGKRDVLDADKSKLVQLGKLLASETGLIRFRSGNAAGADNYFSEGVCTVDSKRLQVIVPYDDHRKKANQAYDTISLDNIDMAAEPQVVYQSKQNKKTETLIDKYVSGNRDRFSIKAAYIIRDTIKVIGIEGIRPASFGIFYDDLNLPQSGGTGHTMNVCRFNKIPWIDQSVWLTWL